MTPKEIHKMSIESFIDFLYQDYDISGYDCNQYKSLIELYYKKNGMFDYKPEHMDVSEGEKPERNGSAEDVLLKVIADNSEISNMTINDIKELGHQYGIITINEALQAMNEFASLREVKMPDKQLMLYKKESEIKEYLYNSTYREKTAYSRAFMRCFDYTISELKRLNNLK